MDNDQKKFILQLANDIKFFCAFVNPCMMQNQRRSQSSVHLTPNLPIKCLIANYYMRWRKIFKGLSQDGELADFSKKPFAPLSLMKTFQMSLVSAGSI
jgi:hypothetical protein